MTRCDGLVGSRTLRQEEHAFAESSWIQQWAACYILPREARASIAENLTKSTARSMLFNSTGDHRQAHSLPNVRAHRTSRHRPPSTRPKQLLSCSLQPCDHHYFCGILSHEQLP